MKYIIEKLSPESLILFYLHPNANISYLIVKDNASSNQF